MTNRQCLMKLLAPVDPSIVYTSNKCFKSVVSCPPCSPSLDRVVQDDLRQVPARPPLPGPGGQVAPHHGHRQVLPRQHHSPRPGDGEEHCLPGPLLQVV